MGIRNSLRHYLLNRITGGTVMQDYLRSSIKYSQKLVSEDNILESSDVTEILNDISSQIAMAKMVVKDEQGNRVDSKLIERFKHPNGYLSQTEFMQLAANVLLLKGDLFLVDDGRDIHIVSQMYSEMGDDLVEHYYISGNEIPASLVEHVKKIGVRLDKGTGILDLAKQTLEGVMNAESTLNTKYIKGGLLALLLKVDTILNPSNTLQSAMVAAIKGQLEQANEPGETKIIPLGKGYDIGTLESPVDDDKVLSYLNVYKPDLGKFFGINVDTYQEMMKSDVEKAMMYLHNKSVRPILQNLADHYTDLIFDKNSKYHIEFEINTLDFVSYSTKTTIAYNNIRAGLWSPNDGSTILGTPKSDNPLADERFISRDLVPLNDIEKIVEASLKGGGKNENRS